MLRSLPFVLFSMGLAAQQFAPFAGRDVAEVPLGRCSVLALADCDGDGDQDAAVNVWSPDNFSVRLRGPGQQWTTITLLPGIVTAAAWADFDGDGDLDLMVGATGSPAGAPFGLFRNDGGTFLWRGQAPGQLNGTVQRFAIGDVDGDLLPDVVVGLTTGVQWVRNLGNTTFGPVTVIASLPQARPALFDRDGDGDLDLVIASTTAVRLFDNTLGVFTNISATLPAGTAGIDVVGNDLDGDGRVDLAFVRNNTVDVAWNQPNGWQLAVAVVPAGEYVGDVLCGDLDRDGDRDLVLRSTMEIDWLRNGGNRSFVRLPALRHGAPWSVDAFALGDAGARGAVDVVGVFRDGQVRTLYGASPEPFLDPQGLLGMPHSNTGLLAVGDVDGDGRLDMISPKDREVLHDDGRGRFLRRPIAGARANCIEAGLADFDGDGDLDLLLGRQSTPTPPFDPMQRLANDGLGNFTPVQDIPVTILFDDFELGDVDGDGDADMLSPTGGQVWWLQNVGNGALVEAGPLSSVQTQGPVNGLVFADLDSDGDRDIVAGPNNNALPVFLNDGSGVFTATGSLVMTPGAYAIDTEAADLDGDGDLDIAVLESPGQLVWYRNNGAAGFTRVAGGFPAGSWGARLEFADIDEDGDVDLYTYGSATLLTNDGTGVFADASARLWASVFGMPRFADVDEDGDVDMLIVFDSAWRRVLNRLRGAESLQVVRAGGAMQVRFYVQPHAPVPGALVLPMAAIGQGPSTAFAGIRGRLLLPSATMVMMGIVDASTGTATTGFAIPPLAGLLGLDLCMQGLVLGAPVGFTNVVDERILP